MSWKEMSVEDLYQTYQEYNEKYFDGKLPSSQEVTMQDYATLAGGG